MAGVTSAWKRHELSLETGNMAPTANARFALTLDRPGTIWLSLVSLFPPTFRNRPNGIVALTLEAR